MESHTREPKLTFYRDMVTMPELSVVTGIGQTTLVRLVTSGQVAASKIGGRWRVSSSEVSRLMANPSLMEDARMADAARRPKGDGSVFVRAGTWYFSLQLGKCPVSGQRARIQRGGYKTEDDALRACAAWRGAQSPLRSALDEDVSPVGAVAEAVIGCTREVAS